MMLDQLYQAISKDAAALPVRFYLGREAISGLPRSRFPVLASTVSTENGVEARTLRLDAGDGLEIRLELYFDAAFGALEWTVWFVNGGAADSPVISEVDAANLVFPGEAPLLKGILGDHENYYAPYCRDLSAEAVEFVSDLGRPTHVYFPYFDLECGDGGCLIALGWGGTWTARFAAEGAGVRFVGRGTNGLCTYLKPGEAIRTPRMSFIPYAGRDEDAAMNKWRRWYVERVLPRDGGAPLKPFSTTCLSCDTGLPNSDGSISERWDTWRPSLEKMFAEGIHIDYRWFDAGWYVDPAGRTVPEDWWGTVGTWELDGEKWPGDSFRESTDYARAHGMRTLMWFEPERVTHVDDLAANWGYRREWALGDPNGRACGNDIGQRDCLDWTAARILQTLECCGVEMYREDNNFNARPCWAALDTENRVGITENKAVVGHYALWDRIIAFERAHGGCGFIDSCASGGGRNDLESLRRSVPLLRSDADRTSTSLRLSMTTALNRWLPFTGASCTEQEGELDPDGRRDMYIFRASYLAVLNLSAQWTQDPNTDFRLIRKGLAEWDRVKRFLLKDFYVLTPWHDRDDRTGWTAFAYLDGDEGVLLAFRMEASEQPSIELDLKAWRDDEAHILTDADSGEERTVRGGRFTVSLPEKRMAALCYIRPGK